MVTYKHIQDWVKALYGFTPKTCWIAHVKHMSGIPMRKAPNRIGEKRVAPCPPEKIVSIQDALRRFGMIRSRN